MLTPYLQSPPVDAASLLHPLGHIIPWDTSSLGTHKYWLRKQWGRGHTDTACPSVGPSPHPQLSGYLDGVPVLGAVQPWGP